MNKLWIYLFLHRLKENIATNIEIENNNEKSYEVIVGIDFGTTSSGAAYSYRNQKDDVYIVSHWEGGTNSKKIPTAILFDDKQNFVAFGQDAVNKFIDIEEGEKEENYFYFHRFKMCLYNEKVNIKNIRFKPAELFI